MKKVTLSLSPTDCPNACHLRYTALLFGGREHWWQTQLSCVTPMVLFCSVKALRMHCRSL